MLKVLEYLPSYLTIVAPYDYHSCPDPNFAFFTQPKVTVSQQSPWIITITSIQLKEAQILFSAEPHSSPLGATVSGSKVEMVCFIKWKHDIWKTLLRWLSASHQFLTWWGRVRWLEKKHQKYKKKPFVSLWFQVAAACRGLQRYF